MLALAGSAWGAIQGNRAELRQEKGVSILGLDFPKAVGYKTFTLTGPDRLVIDLVGVEVEGSLAALAARHLASESDISAIRVARRSADTVRLVLEFKGPAPQVEMDQSASGKAQSLRLKWSQADLPRSPDFANGVKLAQAGGTRLATPGASARGAAADTKVWTLKATPALSRVNYRDSAARDHANSYGLYLDAQHHELFGVTVGANKTSLGYRNGTPRLSQNSGYLSGRVMLNPQALPGQLTLRLDAHRIDNNDATHETGDVGIVAPQVSFLARDKSWYADLGYANSVYGDSTVGNGSLRVDQWTPTVGFAFNNSWDWLQLRAFHIRYSNASRAQGRDQTNSLEGKWTHFLTAGGFVPEQINASLLVGNRLYAVDNDTAVVYNLADRQRGAVTLGAQWKVGQGTRWLLNAGEERYTASIGGADNNYSGRFIYTGLNTAW